jgi:hypothetical protein
MTEPFKVNDRRGKSRFVVGQSVDDARKMASDAADLMRRNFGDTNPYTQAFSRNQEPDEVLREMRLNRRVAAMQKRATGPGYGGTVGGINGAFGAGANVSFATGRPRDPLFYWRENNLPYDITKDSELKKIRAFCSLLYLTHPIIASCIDIFTKFPLQGMSIQCSKDEQIEEFHNILFFEELDYRNYMVDISHQRWLLGEAWPLGAFNETLGVWEGDELLNPDDVEVERSALVKDPRFLIRLPETLRKVLQERSPRWEYNSLIKNYPELQSYAAEDSLMPVSNMLLKQVKFKADTFHKRGIPILMRAFRSVVQEEMLNAALDAIADRLYTPLILVKLGASASDLGTEVPWIPTQGDLETFEESMDAALAGDFRVLVNHFATDITSVFGRENMPDLTGDFDRITDKILQTFGISQSMLNGADQGETYAADALNRDMMATLLTDHQLHLKDFFSDRAKIVAEAQEHYDFEVRNGIRYVKMEEVLKVDEESGEETIVEQPKLLVPTLEFETLTLNDKNTERAFKESLVQAGVPIPMKSRILGMGFDFDEMLEEKQQEQVSLAVAEQKTRRETYKVLRDQRLPIPDDLVSDFRPIAKQPGQPLNPAQDAALPLLGGMPQDLPALAPTLEDQQAQDEQDSPGPQEQDGPSNVIMMPMQAPEEGDQRPPESDEQRANMPKPARRIYASQQISKTAQAEYDRKVRGQIKTAMAEHYEAPDNSIEDPDRPQDWQPTGKFGAPRHLGMRAHVAIPESLKWHDELDDEGTA